MSNKTNENKQTKQTNQETEEQVTSIITLKVTSDTGLNMREEADLDAPIIKVLSFGDEVNLVEKIDNNWALVEKTLGAKTKIIGCCLLQWLTEPSE